jgi:hypothetical protein
MWYVLIICAIIAMIYSNRARGSRRPPKGFAKTVGTPTVTIVAACTVMAVVCGMIHLSTQSRSDVTAARLEVELKYAHAAGFVTATETVRKTQDPNGIIVIAPAFEDPAVQAYQNAIIDGVREAAGSIPVEIDLPELVVTDDDNPQHLNTTHRRLGISDLEAATRAFPKYNVIICISDLPDDYASSAFAARVSKSDFSVGLVLNDVFSLGDEIFSEQVTVCSIPKRALSYNYLEPVPGDPLEAFGARYHLLTSGNVQRFALDNRRMMRIERTQ